ncbi:hypothetical protein F4804DRAFT_232766 [Jackrogersella minutella]|nr:hypothetical protein F4804DRAFT_232766 [Jackrogersella minutella]
MPSPKFPPGLTLGPTSAACGRSVISTSAFGPGDVIAVFTDEPSPSNPDPEPVVAVPDNPNMSSTCGYCLRIGGAGEMLACKGCHTTHYCNAACQKRDWALVHGKRECKAFRRARDTATAAGLPPATRILPTPVRALIQVLLRPDVRDAVLRMEGHERETRTAPGTKPEDMQIQSQAALSHVGDKTTAETIRFAVGLTCRLQVNSFSRLDADIGQGGMYVNAALAMINHSCIPNAFVQFVGRKAILHADREIKKGEEITITYVETTRPRAARLHHLKTHYYFDCVCPRCKDDLDVYQVCQNYPNLELNSFSLAPDVDKLRHPPIKQFPNSSKPLQRNLAEVHELCDEPLQGDSPAGKREQLCKRWKLCAQLRKAELYAIDPLYQELVDAAVYLGDQGKFGYALAITCFLALKCDPYRTPMPFAGPRLKGVMMIAKLLATGPLAATVGDGGDLATRVSQALKKLDQVTICQVLLMVAIHHSPSAHSKEWRLYHEAKDLLKDLESLPSRETETALVDAFGRNQGGSEERRFFNTAVLEPIRGLAGFALEIMEAEFRE